ncbi:putative phosphohydrolase [Desulfosporosinus acidiphilus SJ4]|uniref:Putative phosphohydrolase n=1 Tax=Desulfosporosinus acidiphilus (strain DSM 22704 / JCM 16185 / SJ4) TaxID=646529 RepID=I4D1Z0_DESAJ|nr:metallophosphoesterase [Desulfosporosinus acidiphilus]AFM39814.1 putative phosphohydrolase [Desulfosporosinus acidiphilus SJ4]
MANPFYILIGVIFLAVYGGINFYIGLRGWQALFSYIPYSSLKVYWIVFGMISLSYLIARSMQKFLPQAVYEGLNLVGAYWMAFMFYFLFMILAVDLLRLINHFIHLAPLRQGINPGFGLAIFILVLGIVGYGAWNARNPRVNHYDITIGKKAGPLKQLHVVMVSDIHLGTIIHNNYLTKMVGMINQLNPDLVLFAGDVFDENVEAVNKQEMMETFKNLKSRYGAFAVLGNHEYIGGNVEEAMKYLSAAGVQVLKDSYQEINGSFYLVGRDDRSGSRYNRAQRENLQTLLQGVNHSLPIIVMDHQPLQLEEPVRQGVDLQLSGHTHAGQLFPIRLITRRIFEDDWGYLRKGNFQLIVSSGYGTWGPPVRLGNTPEIVDITIKFQ